MNLKVANLVAIQSGIFFGVISWLAYTQIPFGESRPGTETRKSATKPVATLPSAATAPGNEPFQTVDYRADEEPAEPGAEQPLVPPPPHEYSPEAVRQYTALAAQQYYQQIAPRPYVSSKVENRPVVAAPSYAKREQEPIAVPAEYEEAPQAVVYEEPAQIVAYAQPYAFVAYSSFPRFLDRCRPAVHHRNARSTFSRQRPGSGGRHVNDSIHSTSLSADACRPAKSIGGGPRREDSAPSRPPNQGFASRGRR